MVNENLIKDIIMNVISNMETTTACEPCGAQDGTIPVEVSAKHVHLSQKDVEALFGEGYSLTCKRELSQPGQFLAEERVSIATAKGVFHNVAVLGPARQDTQVELSMTDSKTLGLKAPVSQSGQLNGAADISIISPKSSILAKGSVIVAQNHIHMTNKDAQAYGLTDGQHVKVKMNTSRPLTFEDVIVRVSDKFSLTMHIDFDEANACCFVNGNTGTVIK